MTESYGFDYYIDPYGIKHLNIWIPRHLDDGGLNSSFHTI